MNSIIISGQCIGRLLLFLHPLTFDILPKVIAARASMLDACFKHSLRKVLVRNNYAVVDVLEYLLLMAVLHCSTRIKEKIVKEN